MGDKSGIEWTDATWSPIRARVKENAPEIAILHGWKELAEIVEKMKGHVGPHCEQVSSGCNHCYSCTNNGRCLPNNGTGLPFDKRSRELVEIFIDETILVQPLHWKRPRKIFVENQSDLFGEWVPFEFIDLVFAVMAHSPQHTFQILTKRPERMRVYCSRRPNGGESQFVSFRGYGSTAILWQRPDLQPWPLPNVQLGVSVEDQPTADKRIPELLQTPAAVRFVSYEPALGPVNFREISLPIELSLSRVNPYPPQINVLTSNDDEHFYNDHAKIDWIIVGGESGPGARPFNIKWARDVRRHCYGAGVPCFIKQMGSLPIVPACRQNHYEWGEGNFKEFDNDHWRITLKDKKGGDWNEWPQDLRVREFPNDGQEAHQPKNHRRGVET